MRWYFKVLLVVIILFFVWVAFSVKGIEDSEKLAAKKQSDSAYNAQKNENNILLGKYDSLSAKADSTEFYLQKVQEMIKTANLPEDKKKVINNYIKEVKTLNEN